MKLFADEEASAEARRAAHEARLLFASPLAYVEARAALGRRYAEGRFTGHELATARAVLDRYWRDMSVVAIDAELTERAGALAEQLALRGADAVHLASAQRVAAASEEPALFATWDERLRAAARREGISTVPP